MGGSGSKRRFFWQKKRSPVERTWGKLQKLSKNKKKKSKRKPSVPGLSKLKAPARSTGKTPVRPPWHHRLSLGALHKSPDRGGDGKEQKGPRDKRSVSLPLLLSPKQRTTLTEKM